MKLNIKTHMQMIGKILYAYFLAVALAWAAFPIIVIFLSRFQFYVVLSIYTFGVTLVLISLMYVYMHGCGETDRKPYKWVRYNAKGFVCAAAAFAALVIAELIVIYLADKYIIVRHPYFTIASFNHYAKLILYMPFFWFYRMIAGAPVETMVPEVTVLTSLVPSVAVILSGGIGYAMGFNGIKIIKNPPKNDFIRKLIYGGPRKKKKMKAIPKEDAK